MATRMNVRALRHSMGMSTEDLADRIGVHARTIERWESGRVAPSPLAISRLRELQHPTLPRRRDYTPQQMNDAQASSAPAVSVGGITPSRRLAE